MTLRDKADLAVRLTNGHFLHDADAAKNIENRNHAFAMAAKCTVLDIGSGLR